MKVQAIKVTKGMTFRESQPDEEMAVVEARTIFGWTFSWEMLKKEWQLIGKTMGWDQP